MDTALSEYLRGLIPVASERVIWSPEFEADVSSYITNREPPLGLVTSVRAIVRRANAVLVFDDERGAPHVAPGGRRDVDEPLRDALLRELAEETGCRSVSEPRLLGAMHFHNLRQRPAGSSYPYPDFLQAVYAVVTSEDPVEPTNDPWVRSPRFVSLGEAHRLRLRPCERAFLVAR